MSYRINLKYSIKKGNHRSKRNLTGSFAFKRGFVFLMAVMMLLSVITGCSVRNQEESVNERSSLQSDTGSEASSGVNGSVSDVPSADTDGSGAASDGSGGSGAASDGSGGSGAASDGPGGSGTASDELGGSGAASDKPAASSGFPLTVTDANGDTMTLESPPQRIISLTLGSDEILFSLVDKSRIVSMTRYADDEGISNIAAEAKGLGARTTMDMIENIIALAPDLVILDTWADANYIKQLRDSGITVYAFRTPNNIDEQKVVIAELAHLVGADEKGQEIINWMEEKLNAVEEKLSALRPEQKLTVMDYGELGSSGKGTNFDDIVTRAGLINVISRAGIEGWPMISKEKIIEFDPDVIILPSWYYDANNSFESMRDSLVNDPSLQTVSAVKNGRIISVPNPHISAISQYVVLAVEDVAKAAYPELFE
jgi:iron complex transport system substrate-binding protein